MDKLTKKLIVRVIVTVVGSCRKPIRKTAKNKIDQPLSATVRQLVGSIGKSDKIKFYSPHTETCKNCQRLIVARPSVICSQTPSLAGVNVAGMPWEGCRIAYRMASS